MSNFFTDARIELIARLKADPTIAPLVQTWREWGPGLRKRLLIEPAWCPLVSIYPDTGDVDYPMNAANEINQDLAIRIATLGHDVAPMEELLAAILSQLDACKSDNLGMASDGLKSIGRLTFRWAAVPQDKEGVQIIWQTDISLRINWARFR